MKKYLVTEINVSSDFNQPRPQEIRTELPPGGTWLTREEVEKVLERVTMDRDIEDILDIIFGEKP